MMTLSAYIDEISTWLKTINDKKDQAIFDMLKNQWPESILPTHVTLARIGIGLVLFLILFNFKTTDITLVFLLFLTGVFTEAIDGVLIRKFGKDAGWSAFLDPIADRILILPVAFYALAISNTFLLVLIILMEIFNAYITLFAEGTPIFFESTTYGKAKMFLQSAGFLGILVFWPLKFLTGIFVGLVVLSLVCFAIHMRIQLARIFKYHAAQKQSYQNLQHAFRQEGIAQAPEGQTH